MTEGKTTQEPTMEEILASIRRIISEDGPDKGSAPVAETKTNGASGTASRETDVSQTVSVAAEEDEDDLVLTDMVVGDGAVVALDEEEPAPAPDLILDEIEPEPAAVNIAPEAPMPPETPPAAMPEPESEPEPIRPAMPAPEPPRPAAAPPEPARAPPPRQETTPEPDPMETELVSPEVAAASAASMAQLVARKAQQTADQHSGADGLLVETLVRQAVEPMLRDWLDVHLQGIVEKLVRREVERISRRAELG